VECVTRALNKVYSIDSGVALTETAVQTFPGGRYNMLKRSGVRCKIFTYCSWVSTRWQWSVNFYKNRKETAVYKRRTNLPTHSMVQSPSWEANWFAASQEIPRISRNPKVHYRTHKRTPPVSILGQPNPVHIPTSHLQEIRPDIIHPSTPLSPSSLFPSDFPTKTLYTTETIQKPRIFIQIKYYTSVINTTLILYTMVDMSGRHVSTY
jgi:hypothetical protein